MYSCDFFFHLRTPVAVGFTAQSAEDMFYSAMRGKGIIIQHVYKDHLW